MHATHLLLRKPVPVAPNGYYSPEPGRRGGIGVKGKGVGVDRYPWDIVDDDDSSSMTMGVLAPVSAPAPADDFLLRQLKPGLPFAQDPHLHAL